MSPPTEPRHRESSSRRSGLPGSGDEHRGEPGTLRLACLSPLTFPGWPGFFGVVPRGRSAPMRNRVRSRRASVGTRRTRAGHGRAGALVIHGSPRDALNGTVIEGADRCRPGPLLESVPQNPPMTQVEEPSEVVEWAGTSMNRTNPPDRPDRHPPTIGRAPTRMSLLSRTVISRALRVITQCESPSSPL